jgi:glycerophosphoryl diester phosphodiesterase
MEVGVDGIECDVRLTRDGHLVCIHDRRLDRTSNGTGLVSASTLDDLRRLDFGSWHPNQEPDEPARVLTLDDLLAAVVDSGKTLRVLIETKHPSRYGAAVEQGLVTVLRRYGLAGPQPAGPISPAVMSFSPLALRRMRVLAPAVATVFLFDVGGVAVRDGRAPYGAAAVGPSVRALAARPELVTQAHERGLQVYVWTVNRDEDVDQAVAAGVDALITDRPAAVLARLGRS